MAATATATATAVTIPPVATAASSGVMAAQFAAMALGVFAITGEYRSGQIRSTFNADPARSGVLAAKAVVVGGVAFATSLASEIVSLHPWAGLVILAGYLLALGWLALWATLRKDV